MSEAENVEVALKNEEGVSSEKETRDKLREDIKVRIVNKFRLVL